MDKILAVEKWPALAPTDLAEKVSASRSNALKLAPNLLHPLLNWE